MWLDPTLLLKSGIRRDSFIQPSCDTEPILYNFDGSKIGSVGVV